MQHLNSGRGGARRGAGRPRLEEKFPVSVKLTRAALDWLRGQPEGLTGCIQRLIDNARKTTTRNDDER